MLRKIIWNHSALKNVIVHSGAARKHKRLQMIFCSQKSAWVHNASKFKEDYSLRDFMKSTVPSSQETGPDQTSEQIPYLDSALLNGDGQKGM